MSDHTVTRVVVGDPAVSGADILKLHRAAEDLLARKRAEDAELAELLNWARTQPRSWLAAELDYDLSNLAKVLAGKIRPKRVLRQILSLRSRRR